MKGDDASQQTEDTEESTIYDIVLTTCCFWGSPPCQNSIEEKRKQQREQRQQGQSERREDHGDLDDAPTFWERLRDMALSLADDAPPVRIVTCFDRMGADETNERKRIQTTKPPKPHSKGKLSQHGSSECPKSGDDVGSKTGWAKGAKKRNKLAIQTNSSPELFDATKIKTVGERQWNHDGCASPSGFRQAFISSNEMPAANPERIAKHPDHKRIESQSGSRRAKLRPAKHRRRQVTSKLQSGASVKCDGNRAESRRDKQPEKDDGKQEYNTMEFRIHSTGDLATTQSKGTTRKLQTSGIREEDGVEPHSEGADYSRLPSYRKIKERELESAAPAVATRKGVNHSTGISTVESSEGKVRIFSGDSNAGKKKGLESGGKWGELRRVKSQICCAPLQRCGPSEDGMRMSSIDNCCQALRIHHQPESHCQIGLLKRPKSNIGRRPSSPLANSREQPLRNLSLLLDTLRIIVIVFSTASVMARGFVAFGNEISLLLQIYESPILWAVSWFVALCRVVLIMSESDVGLPVLVPKTVLDSFLLKGCMILFIGLTDLCTSPNKSSAYAIDEIQGVETLSETAVNMRRKLWFGGVRNRGVVACGLFCALLGLIGHVRPTRGRSPNRVLGLAKYPARKQMASL